LPISKKKAAKRSHNVLKKGAWRPVKLSHAPLQKNLKAKRKQSSFVSLTKQKNQHPPQVAVQSKNNEKK